MKEFFKSIGISILYFIGCFIVYYLLMLLFIWMANRSWFFIVFIGLGLVSVISWFSDILISASMLFFKNLLRRILLFLICLFMAFSSIRAVWITDFHTTPAKEITVQILATIEFLSIFVPIIIAVFPYLFKSDKL